MAYEDFITVFTDASHCSNTHAYGWAVWIKVSGETTIRLSGGGLGLKYSHLAEREGLEQAVKWLNDNYHTVCEKRPFLSLQCDCEGELNRINVAKLPFTRVWKKHVKAHRGYACKRSAVNTWCDKEARRLMRFYRQRNNPPGGINEAQKT